MRGVFVFGGTTEGRRIAERISRAGIPVTVSVAGTYGAEVMDRDAEGIRILCGRMDADEMSRVLSSGDYCCVIDATHPFARIVSGEIGKACKRCGLTLLRMRRGTDDVPGDCVPVHSIEEAALFCRDREGKVLLTTGSKEAGTFVKVIGDSSRVYARVLPDESSIRALNDAGLKGKQIIAMQGPFDRDMNEAMLRMTGASFLVTKASGEGSGFHEKIEAANALDVCAVVIERPADDTPDKVDEALPEEELLEKVFDICGVDRTIKKENERREVLLAGIGPGREELQTREVSGALGKADVIFGARTILERLPDETDVPRIPYYRREDIEEYLDSHDAYRNPVVVFSGDVSLFSGAMSYPVNDEGGRYRYRLLPGISSVSFLAAKAGLSQQDAPVISMHGRRANLIGSVARNKGCYVLTEGAEQVREIGESLAGAIGAFALPPLRIVSGFQLGLPDEEIKTHTAETLCGTEKEGLYVLYIEHRNDFTRPVTPGIPDDAFLRAKVPMTKREVRVQALSMLMMSEDAVMYDIGAGTGSVAVEAARLLTKGHVYAFEQKKEAAELTKENRERFAVCNMTVICGSAPECFWEIEEEPDCAFIGGSGGLLRDIVDVLYKKNPWVRVVISTVTLETQTEAFELVKDGQYGEAEIVQIAASRANVRGRYHMMEAINPVYLIAFGGIRDD